MSFIVSVVASIVGGLILGYLFALKKYINVLRYFGTTRKMWKPFFQNNTAVIITGRKGQFPRSTIKNSFSELLGVINLRDFFAKFNKSFAVYNSMMDTSNIFKSQNVILLGSQNANPVTKIISERIAIPFSYNEKGNLVSKNTEYGTVLNTNGQIVEDFALIIKCSNPYNDEKKIMVLAGNHGCATEAAVHFVVSKAGIANIGKRLNSSDFLAIIKIEVDNNIPKRIELLKCWKFAEVIK